MLKNLLKKEKWILQWEQFREQKKTDTYEINGKQSKTVKGPRKTKVTDDYAV